MGEDLAPEIRDDALAERDDEIVAHGAGEREQAGQHEEHREIGIDEARVGAGEAVVDHAAHGDRQDEGRDGGGDERDDGAADETAIAAYIGSEPAQRTNVLARGLFLRDVFCLCGHHTPVSSALRHELSFGSCYPDGLHV